MRTDHDFSPLFRSSIGFDRIVDLLENAARVPTIEWPPYDIAKVADDRYRITMAVSGFAQDDLSITLEPNLLIVRGADPGDDSGQYLYRGIAAGSFERRFELADHIEVAGASLDDGLLTIELVHALPEEMRPHRIAIGRSQSETLPPQTQAA